MAPEEPWGVDSGKMTFRFPGSVCREKFNSTWVVSLGGQSKSPAVRKTGYGGRGGRVGGVGAKPAAPSPLGTAPSPLLSSPLYIPQVYTTARVHTLGPGKVTGIREGRDRQP